MIHDHNDGHGHGHDHGAHAGHGGHGHSHAPKDFGRAFAIGVALNVGFVAIEAAYGFWSNSMALLADAGHNLSDIFGLLLAWGASALSKRPQTARYTYGLGSSTILAALANAVLLLVAVGAIAWEAVGRLSAPEPVASVTVMVVAAIGVVINGLTAWLFASGGERDINIRGAYLHMAADAAISLGVVLAGLVILLTGWLWIDPAASLVISAIIVVGTWTLLKDSLALALDATPRGIEPDSVRVALTELPGVAGCHDLHIWPLSTTETALTCHLVMPDGSPGDGFLASAADLLHQKFGIDHSTLQIERAPAARCRRRTPERASRRLL